MEAKKKEKKKKGGGGGRPPAKSLTLWIYVAPICVPT